MTADERRAEFIALTHELITPTIDAMKVAYNPLIDQARAEGKVDAEQEAAIAELNTRLDKLHAV